MLRCVRVGTGGEPAHVGAVGAGHPRLDAVDHVLVAVADRPRLHGGEVGPSAGLRVERGPAILGAGDARQVEALLLLVAVEHDRGTDGGDAYTAAARRVEVRHFLVVEVLHEVGGIEAAVLLRPRHREPAAVGELLRDHVGEGVALLGVDRLGEAPRRPVGRKLRL